MVNYNDPYLQGTRKLHDIKGGNPRGDEPWYGTDLQYELGDLDMQSDLIGQLMNNPQYAQLWDHLQQGLDPRTRNALQGLYQQKQGLLQGGEFGQAEGDAFRNLISGQALQDESGILNRMIQERMAPQRDTMRGLLASRGMGPGTGSYGSAVGTLAGEQSKALQDVMVQRYLDMVRTGTSGLGTMEQGELGRQQLAGQLGMFGAELPERARQFGLNYGLNLTQAQQQPLANLLQMSQFQRLNKKPSGWENVFAGAAEVAPYIIDAYFPGGGTAVKAASSGGGGGDRQKLFGI